MKPIAFIYISKGASPALHHSVHETEQHRLFVYGVPDIEEGCVVAKKLVDEGCRIIELCGGFGPEGARRVIAAIDGRVPVGYIDFFPEEQEKRLRQRLEEAK
jgi:riboflavin synthase